MFKGLKGVGFLRNCGAASVGEYNKVIWYLKGVRFLRNCGAESVGEYNKVIWYLN